MAVEIVTLEHAWAFDGDLRRVEAVAGETVAEILERTGTREGMIRRNGHPIDTPEDVAVRDGDHLEVCPSFSGDPVSLAIGFALFALSTAATLILSRSVSLPPPVEDQVGPRQYGFDRVSQQAQAGGAVPVPMGDVVSYGGKEITAVTDENEDGESVLRLLILLGAGEIDGVGSLTADADEVDASGVTGIWLNDDQPLSQFKGAKVSLRTGTAGQAPMRGFEDTEAQRTVGTEGVTLRNTSGSDIADPENAAVTGEVVEFTTQTAVDAVRLRMELPRGLQRLGSEGQLISREVRYRVRTRTADVGAGAGAWDAQWEVVSIEKASRTRFNSQHKIEFDSPAVRDIQVERVSAESDDQTLVDDLVWESVVEVQDTDNTYANRAMLGIELVASENLTTKPSVTARVRGVKVRIHDGVSPAEAPVFSTGWSNNNADLALETITNPRWGMGRLYGDVNVDMESYIEFRERCDELVARPGGGTRKRHTFNYVFTTKADGPDQLRKICRAANCTPVRVGSVWRFVMFRPQALPAEVYGDGDIDDGTFEDEDIDEGGSAGEENGGGFGAVRTVNTGGRVKNQAEVQFQNGDARGNADVIAYPEPGRQWLASETPNPETVRVDGITDPDEARDFATLQAKRMRFEDRSCRLVVLHEFPTVLVGERFDVASSMMDWGLGSGRLQHGCTTTTVILDRDLTIQLAEPVTISIVHEDGSAESKVITNAPGFYEAGSTLTLEDALVQSPTEHASYTLGSPSIAATRPYLCSKVEPPGDIDEGRWKVHGVRYVPEIFDPDPLNASLPAYPQPANAGRAPGPVQDLIVTEQLISSTDGLSFTRRIELSWTQSPDDARRTDRFVIGRQVIGARSWVLNPEAVVATRGAVFDVTDPDLAYRFSVVAVDRAGARLDFDDPRVPKTGYQVGLTQEPPDAPTNLAANQSVDGSYVLTWDAVEGAVEYQVICDGRSSSRLNDGAENGIVVARVNTETLSGLWLAPSQSVTFWVRAVGESGRLSFEGDTITIASPAVPAGVVVKDTEVVDLENDGTTENLSWDGTLSALVPDDPDADAVWTSDAISTGSDTLSRLMIRAEGVSDAEDPLIADVDFKIPSVEADQFGVIASGDLVLVWPPHPDEARVFAFEVQFSSDGVVFGPWEPLTPVSGPEDTFSHFRVRATLSRSKAPYVPALGGLTIVTTN